MPVREISVMRCQQCFLKSSAAAHFFQKQFTGESTDQAVRRFSLELLFNFKKAQNAIF